MRRILEIGHGAAPLGRPYGELRRSLPQGCEYHGIDFPSKAWNVFRGVDSLREEYIADLHGEWKQGGKENIFFYRMDARRLAFSGNSFDEVHLYCVLNDPKLSLANVVDIINECARVVKPSKEGGSCIIKMDDDAHANERLGHIVNYLELAGFSPDTRDGCLERSTVLSSMLRNVYTDYMAMVVKKDYCQ
jgi:hypothetical protein